MSLEILQSLEDRIDTLLSRYSELKAEHETALQQIQEHQARVSQLESENESLNSQLSEIKGDSQSRQEKLDAAAERIQALLSKLETV